jgi:iron-sulfur cluster protein
MSDSKYLNLKKRVLDELKKEKERNIRKEALNIIRDRHQELEEELDIEKLRRDYIKIKKFSINNLNRLKKLAFKRLEENGCQIYEAETPKEALDYLSQIIKDDLLVKSKTNVSKEINLLEELKNKQIEVIETDLGDRLVQLANLPAAHPILPSLCISKEQAYSLLTGKKVAGDSISIGEVVKIASEGLRERILGAKVALTGANAITAEEGFIGLIENEGNQRLITSLAKKHIILTGIDKIVPNAQDAITIMKAASYFGLGTRIAGYFSFISGPSKTGDIESTICYGMHGPEEVHVIFINNYRSYILNSEFKDILMCCSCGGCTNYCPVFEEIGANTFGGLMAGGRGMLYTLNIKGVEEAFVKGLNLCTTCGGCTLSCPGEIDVSDLIMKARIKSIAKGIIIPKHKEICNSILIHNNPFDEPSINRVKFLAQFKNQDFLNSDSKTLLFLGCMGSYRVQNQAISTIELLEKMNIDFKYLGTEEPCCAGVLYRLGFMDQFNRKLKQNVEILKNYDQIILICPGCYTTFKKFYNDNLQGTEIKHIIELIDENIKLDLFKKDITTTYHDPCHLARELQIIEPPRQILRKISDFKEMKFSGYNAKCCGAGGGVLSSFPELSHTIAETRVEEASLIENIEYLLTVCPFCEYNLKKGNNKKQTSMEIKSIQEYLVNNIEGGKKK